MELSRRELLAAGATAGTVLALDGPSAAGAGPRARTVRRLDFATLPDGDGVVYAGDECHFTLLEVRAATLDLRLVREDGAVPYERRFDS